MFRPLVWVFKRWLTLNEISSFRNTYLELINYCLTLTQGPSYAIPKMIVQNSQHNNIQLLL